MNFHLTSVLFGLLLLGSAQAAVTVNYTRVATKQYETNTEPFGNLNAREQAENECQENHGIVDVTSCGSKIVKNRNQESGSEFKIEIQYCTSKCKIPTNN